MSGTGKLSCGRCLVQKSYCALCGIHQGSDTCILRRLGPQD